MRKLGSGHHWSGKAADAFREAFDMHPKQWMHAADACDDASKALKSYAETVTWAQGKAVDAIEKYRKAQQAAERAQSEYESQYDSYRERHSAYEYLASRGTDAGAEPQAPSDPGDVGKEGREAAEDILKDARSQRNEAADRARNAIKGALAHAPDKPAFTELAGAALKDGGEAFVLAHVHMVGGALKAGADTLKLARTINPLDPYNITHPWKYAGNTATLLMGLAQAGLHPIDTAKGMLGSGWGSDPFDSFSAAIVNAVGGKGAGALAKGVAKAGAKNAAKAAARTAAKEGGKRTVRDRLRTAWCKTFGSDPIDMATGRMHLPQTDITLPGSLPLAFTRTFESSYRTGRWFGPTWMSTVDQRLEIDSEGVILIGEEGNFLLYPHPAVGVPTLPIEGDGAPLELTPDGDYLLTDPVTGTRRYFTTYAENLAVLDEISDRRGNHHTFDYTADGTPPPSPTAPATASSSPPTRAASPPSTWPAPPPTAATNSWSPTATTSWATSPPSPTPPASPSASPTTTPAASRPGPTPTTAATTTSTTTRTAAPHKAASKATSAPTSPGASPTRQPAYAPTSTTTPSARSSPTRSTTTTRSSRPPMPPAPPPAPSATPNTASCPPPTPWAAPPTSPTTTRAAR